MPNPRDLVTPRQYPRSPRKGATAGLLGFTTTAAIAAMMLVYIDASNPELTFADAEQQAGQSLQRYGYNWAKVELIDGVAHLKGEAPSETERIIAYEVVRKTLRPMMGRSGPVEAISSHLTLTTDAQAQLAKAKESRTRIVAEAEPRTISAAPAATASFTPSAAPVDVSQALAANAAPATPPEVEAAEKHAAPAPVEERVAERAPPDRPQTAAATGAQIETAAVNPPRPEAAKPEAAAPAAAAPVEVAANTAMANDADDGMPSVAPATAGGTAGQLGSKSDCKAEFADALSSTKIVFGSDSAVIDKQSRPLLDKLAAIAKRCSRFSLVVEGHTDGSGRKGHNNALSKKRAEAVRWALVDRGVDMDHITAEGFGAARPIDRSGSAEAKARNRRIEFSVLEPSSPERKAATAAK